MHHNVSMQCVKLHDHADIILMFCLDKASLSQCFHSSVVTSCFVTMLRFYRDTRVAMFQGDVLSHQVV